MGDLNAAGQAAGQEREGSPASAPGAEGGGVQGGAQNQNAEGDGNHLAGVLSRIREGRFHANDEAMLRRWQQGSTERDGFAEKVTEFEGRTDGLRAWADKLMLDVPLEDQGTHKAYREENGDEAYIQARFTTEASAPDPSTQQTPPEETEEQRMARLVKEAVANETRPFFQKQAQSRAEEEFRQLLEKEVAGLKLSDKARDYLRKDVQAHAQAMAREIAGRRRADLPVSQMVPTIVKERAAALSELLSAHGETVTTGLVSQSEPKQPEIPTSPRSTTSPEEVAGMDVDDYWDAQMVQGESRAPAEGGAG